MDLHRVVVIMAGNIIQLQFCQALTRESLSFTWANTDVVARQSPAKE